MLLYVSRQLSLIKSLARCILADVAELADAPDLGSGVNDVGVQVPSSAPVENLDTHLRIEVLFLCSC